MIVTIDGPAGSGKSTAAKKLARRLGFRFIDTGAMYRAVALAGKRNAVDWADEVRLAKIAANLRLQLTDDRILMNGEDVSDEIRTVEITTLTQHAADNQAVRRLLVDQQRQLAAGQNVVTDGRDQATVVFPDAECKIYLTAGEEERADGATRTWNPAARKSTWLRYSKAKSRAIAKTPLECSAPWPRRPIRSSCVPTACRPSKSSTPSNASSAACNRKPFSPRSVTGG